MKKPYLDANVVLDFVLKRSPFDAAAQELFALAEHGQVQLLVSSLTFTVVHYVTSKQVGKAAATGEVVQLFRSVSTVAVNEQVVGRALQANLPDFEDAVQLFAAPRSKRGWPCGRERLSCWAAPSGAATSAAQNRPFCRYRFVRRPANRRL